MAQPTFGERGYRNPHAAAKMTERPIERVVGELKAAMSPEAFVALMETVIRIRNGEDNGYSEEDVHPSA